MFLFKKSASEQHNKPADKVKINSYGKLSPAVTGRKNMKKEDLNKQFDYVLSCINDDNETLSTPEEKIQYFAERFNDEFNNNYNKHRFRYIQDRIGSYLRCLPSCCSVTFSDYEIIQIGKRWGFCNTPIQEDRFCENWWDTIALRIMQLSKKYNIDL